MTSPLTHISDTARWVAVYRAMESERPDAIFKDPFARRLAPRGAVRARGRARARVGDHGGAADLPDGRASRRARRRPGRRGHRLVAARHRVAAPAEDDA